MPWCSTVVSTQVFVDSAKGKGVNVNSRSRLGPDQPKEQSAAAVVSCCPDTSRGTLALKQCGVTKYAHWLHNCVLSQSGNTFIQTWKYLNGSLCLGTGMSSYTPQTPAPPPPPFSPHSFHFLWKCAAHCSTLHGPCPHLIPSSPRYQIRRHLLALPVITWAWAGPDLEEQQCFVEMHYFFTWTIWGHLCISRKPSHITEHGHIWMFAGSVWVLSHTQSITMTKKAFPTRTWLYSLFQWCLDQMY